MELTDGTKLKNKGRQHISANATLRLSLPGGGGYGEPKERDRAAVRADIAAGYITPEQARDTYELEDNT